jgi:uncharacterized membrane protein
MIINVPSTVAAGSYPIFLSASGNLSSGGSITKVALITLDIPGFTLAGSKTLSINPGATQPLTLTTTGVGGFSSAVALSVSGLPTGVTGAFSPASVAAPGSGTSTLNLTAASSATPGSYTATITAAGGGVTQTLSLALTITVGPAITLTESSSSGNFNVGASGSVTVTVADANGFNAAVGFDVSGLPAGATASFTPATIAAPGAGSTKLAFVLAANTPVRSYPVTITATGSGISKTITYTLNVNGFMFSCPATLQSLAGKTASVTLTTTAVGNFNYPISLSYAGMPPMGSLEWFGADTIAAPGTGSTTLSFMLPSSLPTGSTPLTVSAVGNGVTITLPLTVIIVGPDLTAAQGSGSVLAGATGNFNFTTADLYGFSSDIGFTITGLPSGVTAAFSPSTITAPGAGATQMALTLTSAVTGGSYPLTITATGGGVTKTAKFTLDVPDFTISGPASTKVFAGGTSQLSLTLTLVPGSAFSSSIALSIAGLPSGVTATFAPTSVVAPGAGASTLTITASAATALGQTTPVITAKGGGITHTLSLPLTVAPAPTFTMTESQSSHVVKAGFSALVSFSIAVLNGFNSAVAFSVAGLPTGVTATFSPTSIGAPGSGSTMMTLTLASTAAAGSYPLTITATGGGVTKTATFTLNVPNFTLSIPATARLLPAGSTPLSVATAVVGGFSNSVALSITGLPTGVTATFAPATIATPGSGASTLTLAASSAAKAGTYSLTVTAVGNGITHTSSLTLTVK